MSNQIEFSYGVLSDTLEEQANKQGYTLGEEAEKLEKIRKAINMCKFHVATDSQVSSMIKKLHNKVIKALKPLDNVIMTRKKMIERLKEIGSVTLNSKQLEDIMPLSYDYFLDMFQRFVNDPHNKTTEDDLEDFRSGKFLVAIYFGDKTISYTVGRNAQQLANEPDWAEDSWDDIETEELQDLLKVAK